MPLERNEEVQETGEKNFMSSDAFPAGLSPDGRTGATSPTWRGLVIAVIAAIVLSLTATFLLGGSFGVYNRGAAATGCGAGSPCCPPAAGN